MFVGLLMFTSLLFWYLILCLLLSVVISLFLVGQWWNQNHLREVAHVFVGCSCLYPYLLLPWFYYYLTVFLFPNAIIFVVWLFLLATIPPMGLEWLSIVFYSEATLMNLKSHCMPSTSIGYYLLFRAMMRNQEVVDDLRFLFFLLHSVLLSEICFGKKHWTMGISQRYHLSNVTHASPHPGNITWYIRMIVLMLILAIAQWISTNYEITFLPIF